MGDLKDLTQHPKFRQENPASASLQEETLSPEQEEQVISGASICNRCIHVVNRNPWWRRLFRKQREKFFHCELFRRSLIVNCVTGRKIYVTPGYYVPAGDEMPLELCMFVNPYGKCEKFTPKG